MARRERKQPEDEFPWHEGDPGKKIGINIPMPETLMLMLDYLIDERAIRSKSSFIRETVAAAAREEVTRLRRVQEAVAKMDEEDSSKRRAR